MDLWITVAVTRETTVSLFSDLCTEMTRGVFEDSEQNDRIHDTTARQKNTEKQDVYAYLRINVRQQTALLHRER